MKATLLYGSGDVRVEEVPDPVLHEPSDVVIRVTYLEAVGHLPADEQAHAVVRPGGTISRVGVPQYEDAPAGFASLFGKNATLTGGPATIWAYLVAALPQVLDGTINLGQVFDRELPLADIAEAYRLMDSREALTVLIRP